MINLTKIHLRIKHKLKNTKLRKSAVNAVAICVTVALALFFAVQLSKNVSGSMSTLRTQQIVDTESITLKGYIFREERLYRADGQVAEFLIDNGQRVGVGKTVANLYGTVGGERPREIQSQLNELCERIRLLERGITEAKKLSQSTEIFGAIDSSYYAFLSAVEDKNFSLADKEEALFIDAVNSYMVATGRTEQAQSTVDALKADKASFISQNLGGITGSLTVEQSCYFYTECDGYEEKFIYSDVLNMTAEQFASCTSYEKTQYENVIGKQVFSPEWYICFPTSDDICNMFLNNASGESAQKTYDASFISNNGMSLKLTFEKAVHSDSAGNSGFLVFSCKQMPEGFEFLRAQNVSVQISSKTGYRVPVEAVFSEGAKNFVYILNGNIVEKRRITVIGNGDGYYIVNTYENNISEGGIDSEIPYLSVNEWIITSGSNLYDGKLLN